MRYTVDKESGPSRLAGAVHSGALWRGMAERKLRAVARGSRTQGRKRARCADYTHKVDGGINGSARGPRVWGGKAQRLMVVLQHAQVPGGERCCTEAIGGWGCHLLCTQPPRSREDVSQCILQVQFTRVPPTPAPPVLCFSPFARPKLELLGAKGHYSAHHAERSTANESTNTAAVVVTVAAAPERDGGDGDGDGALLAHVTLIKGALAEQAVVKAVLPAAVPEQSAVEYCREGLRVMARERGRRMARVAWPHAQSSRWRQWQSTTTARNCRAPSCRTSRQGRSAACTGFQWGTWPR